MRKTAPDISTWPSTTQAAERLGVSSSYARRLVSEGVLRTVRIGAGFHLVDPASIAALEESRRGLPLDALGRVINRRRARWQPA
jgi:excisionase family DNA binding protein